MSKDKKQGKAPFRRISGLWKRVSTTRVGKDGRPEPYWYGVVREEGDIVISKGDEVFLFPSTAKKGGGPEYFLKVRKPLPGTDEETEDSEEVGEVEASNTN